MREYFVFDDPEIKAILKAYVQRGSDVVEDLGDFVIRRVGRARRLEYTVQDLVDWWDSDLTVGELQDVLRSRYYRVVFKNLLEFSRFRRVLESVEIGWKVSWSKVYYVPLQSYKDSEDLRRSFSRNVWKNVRNSRNRIRRYFGSPEIVQGDPMGLYDWTVERIRRRHPKGLFSDPDYVDVQREILRNLMRKGMLKVWVLRGGEEVLATNYVIESGDVVLSYLAGYEDRGDFYRVLIFDVITSYHRRGFREFNFMKGESAYKRQWTDRAYRLYRYEAVNPSLLRRLLSLL